VRSKISFPSQDTSRRARRATQGRHCLVPSQKTSDYYNDNNDNSITNFHRLCSDRKIHTDHQLVHLYIIKARAIHIIADRELERERESKRREYASKKTIVLLRIFFITAQLQRPLQKIRTYIYDEDVEDKIPKYRW
jgi:hypothetical protein